MAKFKIKLLAFLIFIILKMLFLTCKKKYFGQKYLPSEPCVVLFWHGKLAMMAFIFHFLKKNGYKKTPYVLISNHKDGELIASVMEFFNIKAVRGSTYDEPIKALKQIQEIIKSGNDVYITPDGPRGPYHSVSLGSYKLAVKKNLNVVLISNSANRFYQAKSWDKMILAKPFSKIAFIISKPIKLKEENALNDILNNFDILDKELNKEGFYA